jgi:hypothetical protein
LATHEAEQFDYSSIFDSERMRISREAAEKRANRSGIARQKGRKTAPANLAKEKKKPLKKVFI